MPPKRSAAKPTKKPTKKPVHPPCDECGLPLVFDKQQGDWYCKDCDMTDTEGEESPYEDGKEEVQLPASPPKLKRSIKRERYPTDEEDQSDS